VNARKLESDELDDFHHKKVPREVGIRIQQERNKKSISREDLARAINEKATVVTDIENGNAIMNNGLIAKIEKALGAKVRGN
jgi:putative transcription factor